LPRSLSRSQSDEPKRKRHRWGDHAALLSPDPDRGRSDAAM
jgi:hypothetical protein